MMVSKSFVLCTLLYFCILNGGYCRLALLTQKENNRYKTKRQILYKARNAETGSTKKPKIMKSSRGPKNKKSSGAPKSTLAPKKYSNAPKAKSSKVPKSEKSSKQPTPAKDPNSNELTKEGNKDSKKVENVEESGILLRKNSFLFLLGGQLILVLVCNVW